jgi:hypothetical protein
MSYQLTVSRDEMQNGLSLLWEKEVRGARVIPFAFSIVMIKHFFNIL